MRYEVDFLLLLKVQKIYCFGLCQKILLVNQFAGFFTFDLFDLLILIPGSIATLYLFIFGRYDSSSRANTHGAKLFPEVINIQKDRR